MVNVSIIKILYSALILMKCKRSVDSVVRSSNQFVLIRNSSIFIDKTVILKKIFQYDFLLITAPHKFGKTTNLHMIKLFLGNGNSKSVIANVFRNTNIWQDKEFIVTHVGNYPIIHLSMKAKSVISTFDDLYKELKNSVSEAFLEHKYLLQSVKLGIETKKRYVEYCKSQVKDYEVGLKFLSKILHMHHGRRVTVLIDDFDYALTYSIFKEELDSSKTAELLFRVIDNTINLNEYVGKSVVMGCVPFKLGSQYSGLYLLEHFKFMTTKDFTPYFGFTQRETEKLLDKFQLGKYKKDVATWYGGYAYLYSDFTIYNPWSVLMFLKHKKLDVYWVHKSSQRMLCNYMEPIYELKEHTINLVKMKNVTIQAVSSFTSYEVDKLKSVQFSSYSYAEDSTEDHLFLQLLLESGYLTYANKYRTVPISTAIKIPNLEIRKVFEQILVRLAAVYPDINRRHRGAHPTRYYKIQREPIQSPQQDARRRPYSNQYRGRGQQQQPYTRRESFNNQHTRKPYEYDPYKAARQTYLKYREQRSQFQYKKTTQRDSESEEAQDSSDNSRIYRRPAQNFRRPNKINNRQFRANRASSSQESGSQSEPFIRNPRMSTNKDKNDLPKKYSTQQSTYKRQELTPETEDSESGSFFANYRAQLRAGKIKRTPDLIFNPEHKVEGASSSLDTQESISDSFTYNYKTFEESERLFNSVTTLPKHQSKTHNHLDSMKSHTLQSDLISHHYKTNTERSQAKNMKTSFQESNMNKNSLSLESQSDLSSNHCKETNRPKDSIYFNTQPGNKTNVHVKSLNKESYSIESQSLQRGVSSADYEGNKDITQLKNTLSESISRSKESVSTKSQDIKSHSLEYDSKSYKDDSLSISSIEVSTTQKVTLSPNSFMDLFAHQPSIDSHLPTTKTSSSHHSTRKIEQTVPHSTIKSPTISTRGSLSSSTFHHSLTESTQFNIRTKEHTNCNNTTTVRPWHLF